VTCGEGEAKFWIEPRIELAQNHRLDERQLAVLSNVQEPHAGHLYRPDLDIDLAVDSIRNPERFPLVSRLPNR